MRTLILSSILLAFAMAHAQNSTNVPTTLDAGTSTLHILKQTFPQYPPIAKAAHISGSVKLQIEIGTDGHVNNMEVLSGPPMLIGAAKDCVKNWIYEPVLEDGKPAATSTVVTVKFELPSSVNPNDNHIASQFFSLETSCIKAVSLKIDPAKQADVCKQAADIAQTFSSQERFIERRSAFVYASTALRRNNQLQAALDYANKAVSVIEQGHDDGSGSSAAYGVRAQVEAQLGNLMRASDDLTKAEDFERDAIAKMGGSNEDFVKRQYIPILKSMLEFHAQILSQLGKAEEAQAKTDEAAKL